MELRDNDALQLHNVALHHKYDNVNWGDNPPTIFDNTLNELIWMCATKWPLWKFVGEMTYSRNVHKFCVYANGEYLGCIYQATGNTGKSYLHVQNSRIEAQRTRSNAFRTTIPKAAFNKVKKMFGRKNTNERLSKAASQAWVVLSCAHYNAGDKLGEAERGFSTALMTFGNLPHIQEQFFAYAETDERTHSAVTALTDARLEMQTMNDIRAKYGKADSVLVIRDDDEYIVRFQDRVEIFNDSTLSHEIRARLGMLKLVQDGQAVANYGMRVNEDLFVVILGGSNDNE